LFLFGFGAVVPKAHASNFIWPVRGEITTYFSDWHPGIDIADPCGTPIKASKSGTVTYAGWDTTGYGNRIDIDDHEDYERYGHLSAFDVSTGAWVTQGQEIGLMGATGNATGCHLHLEFHWHGWGSEGWGLPPAGNAVNPLLPLGL
jgi:murein DD-endopeptidase MepM/ murein hydrolase activator NlpD